MTAYTDFHYSPTGSGVISGAQVLEQTEQGINGLGQYVQDNVSGAIDVANEALTTARSADSNATTAINLANSFNAQIIAANQTAGNALTTAQSAQNTANSASSLAATADNNAATALNAANSASAGVTTLTGTVNSLGNRMTSAENAISANAGNITTLQNGLATTNANVTAAANAASAAQATATSAQATATSAKNTAYVVRYTGTTITGGGTIAYADIDNTDNIKAGDKIIDATGAIYEIASVDIANQTVIVGATAIINLAVLPDLFNSANTWTGVNTFSNFITSKESAAIPAGSYGKGIVFRDYQNNRLGYIQPHLTSDSEKRLLIGADAGDFAINSSLIPHINNSYNLGTLANKWKSLNGINPGALSLPDLPNAVIIDTTNWDLTGEFNGYTPTVSGWLTINTDNSSVTNYIRCAYGDILVKANGNGQAGGNSVLIPVIANVTVGIRIVCTVINSAKFYPMQGNV